MQERIVALIALTPNNNPFANDIHCNKRCWDKYVSTANHSKRQDHAPGVTVVEVNAVFIDHVQETVFRLIEPRALTGLLIDYKNIMFDLPGEEKDYRALHIKSLLSDEFGEEIGFQNYFQKNESMLVYDRSNGGTFLESAVNSWGLNIEDLLRNVARQINTEINKLSQMPLPPTVEEVCGEISGNFLTSFVG